MSEEKIVEKKHVGNRREYGDPIRAVDFKSGVSKYFNAVAKEDWNLADLKVWLKITNEQWDEYSANPEYIPTIKLCKGRMESKYLSMLEKRNNVGIIFILKSQFGYTDDGIKKARGESPRVEGALSKLKVKA